MPDEKSIDLSTHPLVSRLHPDLDDSKDVSVLQGYIGPSDQEDVIRIYSDLTFNHYYEVPTSEVLHTQPVNPNDENSPIQVVLESGSTVQEIFSAKRSIEAKYLGGSITANYLGSANVSASPAYAVQAGTLVSTVNPACPTGYTCANAANANIVTSTVYPACHSIVSTVNPACPTGHTCANAAGAGPVTSTVYPACQYTVTSTVQPTMVNTCVVSTVGTACNNAVTSTVQPTVYGCVAPSVNTVCYTTATQPSIAHPCVSTVNPACPTGNTCANAAGAGLVTSTVYPACHMGQDNLVSTVGTACNNAVTSTVQPTVHGCVVSTVNPACPTGHTCANAAGAGLVTSTVYPACHMGQNNLVSTVGTACNNAVTSTVQPTVHGCVVSTVNPACPTGHTCANAAGTGLVTSTVYPACQMGQDNLVSTVNTACNNAVTSTVQPTMVHTCVISTANNAYPSGYHCSTPFNAANVIPVTSTAGNACPTVHTCVVSTVNPACPTGYTCANTAPGTTQAVAPAVDNTPVTYVNCITQNCITMKCFVPTAVSCPTAICPDTTG